jgi:uncharacterized membrane protein YhiD involved in acid resistance
MDSTLAQLDGIITQYSSMEMIVNTVTALIIGVILALVYQSTHKGLSYSQSFSQTIVFVALIVAIIMMVIGGSLARAFALVGALSIIRFRTVLKDTKDISFIFGALALGMAAGTSNYYLAVFGTFSVSVVAFVLHKINFGAIYKSEFILRFRHRKEGDSQAYLDAMNDTCKSSNILHIEPSADNSSVLYTFDISLNDTSVSADLIDKLGKVSDVSEIVLIASKNDVDF